MGLDLLGSKTRLPETRPNKFEAANNPFQYLSLQHSTRDLDHQESGKEGILFQRSEQKWHNAKYWLSYQS